MSITPQIERSMITKKDLLDIADTFRLSISQLPEEGIHNETTEEFSSENWNYLYHKGETKYPH